MCPKIHYYSFLGKFLGTEQTLRFGVLFWRARPDTVCVGRIWAIHMPQALISLVFLYTVAGRPWCGAVSGRTRSANSSAQQGHPDCRGHRCGRQRQVTTAAACAVR
jgi:hypothetical protein